MTLKAEEPDDGDDPDADTPGEPSRTYVQDDDPGRTEFVGSSYGSHRFGLFGAVGAAGPPPASTHGFQ